MGIEYKTAQVTGVSKVTDQGNGVVNAIVSITGVEDNVGDTIVPGAYKETLVQRKPKGVWGHNWNEPVSKPLAVEELMPLDPRLPEWLDEAKQIPWPEEAGALSITTQFNLKTQRGMDAYNDVIFFGDDQEWSIGYKVDPTRTEKKGDKRIIRRLDLFEYSPVLFGAMPNTRNHSVKDAQLAFKTLEGHDVDDLETRYMEYKSELDTAGTDPLLDFDPATMGDDFEDVDEGVDEDGDDYIEDESDEDETFDDDDYEDEDDLFGAEDELDDEVEDEDEDPDLLDELAAKGLTPDAIRSAIKTLEGVLTLQGETKDDLNAYDIADMETLYVEAKAAGYGTVSQAVDDITVKMDSEDSSDLARLASEFDAARKNNDMQSAENAADQMVDIIDGYTDANGDNSGGNTDSVRAVAQVIADQMQQMEGEANPNVDMSQDPDNDGDDDSGDGGDTDGDSEAKWYQNGVEYKNMPTEVRTFGMPKGVNGAVVKATPLEGKDRQRAFVGCLETTDLNALDDYLSVKAGQFSLKTMVSDELRYRKNVERGTEEKKFKTPAKLRAAGRRKAAADNNAMPDGSFPIEDTKDLSNAIMDYNRAKDRLPDAPGVLALIKRRATELNAEDALDSLSVTKGSGEVIETKSLESFMATLNDTDDDEDMFLNAVL